MEDRYRQTGRTTGLILKAIGEALLARGSEVEFIDHYPHTLDSACYHVAHIFEIATTLNIRCDVSRDGVRIFVRATMTPNYIILED
ncbi:MAG: hypothetical protein EOM20_16600 [Spartobacteria bacterium]|nr:hypothetical protein [Spartobacteria bacterium]